MIRPSKVFRGLGAAMILAILLCVSIYGFERLRLARESHLVEPIPGSLPDQFDDRHVFIAPGVVAPRSRSAAESRLAEEDEVIGVLIDGKARAYRLKDMEDRMRHVVNDRIGETPVTVTFCNLNGCVRAFRGAEKGRLLDVSQAGLKGNQMVIRLDGVDYLQATGSPLESGLNPLSIPSIPSTRTTWKAWRADHPESEVVELVRRSP